MSHTIHWSANLSMQPRVERIHGRKSWTPSWHGPGGVAAIECVGFVVKLEPERRRLLTPLPNDARASTGSLSVSSSLEGMWIAATLPRYSRLSHISSLSSYRQSRSQLNMCSGQTLIFSINPSNTSSPNLSLTQSCPLQTPFPR